MFVADRMTPNPVTISPETTVTTAQEMMRKNHFRRLPVMDGEKLVGWVTEEDLRQVAPLRRPLFRYMRLTIYWLN